MFHLIESVLKRLRDFGAEDVSLTFIQGWRGRGLQLRLRLVDNGEVLAIPCAFDFEEVDRIPMVEFERQIMERLVVATEAELRERRRRRAEERGK